MSFIATFPGGTIAACVDAGCLRIWATPESSPEDWDVLHAMIGRVMRGQPVNEDCQEGELADVFVVRLTEDAAAAAAAALAFIDPLADGYGQRNSTQPVLT